MISFCTVTMNRLHHLKKTLIQNIADNIDYPDLEFIILDYNSNDGTEAWVAENMAEYINSGLLKFYRTEAPQTFDRSHSRNMAFRLAGGDLVCNVDADNYIGPGFANYIASAFKNTEKVFLTPNFYFRDVIGRLAIRKNDFLHSGGYNETMKGYGFEDMEYYHRLVKAGMLHHKISNRTFLKVIHHDNEERFANEPIGLNCIDIFLHYVDPDTTEILYQYKDGSFEKGILLDNEDKETAQLQDQFDNKIRLDGTWKKGSWRTESTALVLDIPDEATSYRFKYSVKGDRVYNSGIKKSYYKVLSPDFRNNLKLLKTEMDNRQQFRSFINQSNYQVNIQGFGKGLLKMNFTTVITLQ